MAKRKRQFSEPVIETAPMISKQGSRGTSILDAVGPFIEASFRDSLANDAAARKEFNTTNDLNLINAVTRIDREAFEDPAGQKQIGSDWINGYLPGLPEGVRDKTRAKFDKLLNVSIGNANEASVKKMRERAILNDATLSIQRSAILKSAGRNLWSTDPSAKQASKEQIGVLRDDLTDRLSQFVTDAFGNAIPVYEDSEAAAAIQEFNNTYIGEGLTQWRDSQPDAVRAHLLLLEGGPKVGIPGENTLGTETADGIEESESVQTMTQVNAMDLLLPKKQQEIISLSTKKMETAEKIRVKDKAKADKVQQEGWDLTGATLSQNLQTAPPEQRIDPDTIREMGTLGNIDPAKVEGYVQMSIKPRPRFDNPDMVMGFDAALTAGSDVSELLADPLISAQFTPTTYNRFLAENRTNIQVEAGTSPGPLKKKIDENKTLLKAALKTGRGTFIDPQDNIAVLRENAAVAEYTDRVSPRTDPVTGREVATPEAPQDVMEDLVRRARATFMTSGPGSDYILPLGYGGARQDVTAESLDIGTRRLESQFKSGAINLKVYEDNLLLYDTWYGLAPEILQVREESASTSKQATKLPPRRIE